jgi:guanylate kinase
MGRLVMLSGPSCVGKGPLHKALKRFYPELARKLHKLVLFNSRAPRPGEQDGVDYHFRPRAEIEALRDREGTIVLDVRGDLQCLDLANLRAVVAGVEDAFFEGNPLVSLAIMTSPLLANVARLSVFLSPLSRQEILYLRDPERRVSLPEFIADVQRRKLLHRTHKQKVNLSLRDLEDIERRAGSAYAEMQLAFHFDHVIPNHDGEGNDNWDAFYYPIGDARRALLAFAAVLNGQDSELVEQWGPGLLA